jgi:TRAP transporter TAXI family solute receptor
MVRLVLRIAALLTGCCAILWVSQARTQPAGSAGPRPLSSAEERLLNSSRVGVVGGGPGGTYIRIAHDLGLVLDDDAGHTMRVIAHTGRGSVRNTLDLLHLERVDVAIVQDDVLDYIGRLPAFSNLGIRSKIGYVTTLYAEEIHVLARDGIRSIFDLRGKRVSLDVAESGTEMTARNLFAAFDLPVQEVNMPLSEAIQALAAGRIDGFVFVGGKPLDAILGRLQGAAIQSNRIGFVTLPHDHPLRGGYGKALLTATDYPGLIPAGRDVETWSVAAVMAVYNWFQKHIPETHPRRRIVSTFIERFMGNMQRFCTGFTLKWREVDLSRPLPNWTRVAPAAAWLAATQATALRCAPG